jgi:hypothetical protein
VVPLGLAIRAKQSNECHNPDKGNLMATFYISRQKQFQLILEGSGGYDTVSRERRLKVAQAIKDRLDDPSLDPADFDWGLNLDPV